MNIVPVVIGALVLGVIWYVAIRIMFRPQDKQEDVTDRIKDEKTEWPKDDQSWKLDN